MVRVAMFRNMLWVVPIVVVAILAAIYLVVHNAVLHFNQMEVAELKATGVVKHREPYYTQLLAKKLDWVAEVQTPVGTRCDLVSQTHAVEVEWTTKPYQAVGQALHYSLELDKEPGILFLYRLDSEREFALTRAGKTVDKLHIKVWWYNIDTKLLYR